MDPKNFYVDANGKSAWGPAAAGGASGSGASSGTGLRVYNTISKQVEPFTPTLHADKNLVTWYMCGPTVYDSSHLGHAKTYVCFDIIRRLMTDYFGYNVKLCMNITDIDDKIINRSNEQKREWNEMSRHWETEFFKDMEALNVRLPNVITRVSEYVPEIVQFIEGIIKNGFAYESNGSVYFDVLRYANDPKHTYAKLEPTSFGDAEKLKEGEGSLSAAAEGDKRNPQDFALWKKSKPGEPLWDSPWGPGRPGWHIECSAMAHEVFKEFPIDIHSGGCDLRFPHHDNELAQSEAFYGCDNWIQHFWHTGHLHIDKLKMSKSLKNFLTIREILDQYSARQVRFLFLMHKWDGLLNFSPANSFAEAQKKEDQFDQFFHNIKAILRQCNIKDTQQAWNKEDRELHELLDEKQKAVHEALCDNFDTPKAINELFILVRATNVYIAQPVDKIKIPLVRQVSKFVFKILSCFGIYEDSDFPNVSGEGQQQLQQIMDAFCAYRDAVKNNAKAEDAAKILFRISDELRDDVLPKLGVQIEDKGKEASIWKFDDPAKLMKRRADALAEKQKKADEAAARKALDDKKKSTPGKDWFLTFEADKYSKYDEAGVPTHDAKGKEINEQIRNKLKKTVNSQQAKYEKWLASQEEKK